jgi:hypothetical protein
MNQLHHTTEEEHPVLPITMLPQAGILPRRYVIHHHSTFCRNCQRVHSWPQTYAFNEMMTRTGSGRPVLHLIHISEINFNLPIEVKEIARREVPACHECAGTIDLKHLPDPTNTDEWRRAYALEPAPTSLLYKSPQQPTTTTKRPQGTKKSTTLDDLANF